MAGAESAGSVDEGAVPKGEDLAADNARHREPGDGAKPEEEKEETGEVGGFRREMRGTFVKIQGRSVSNEAISCLLMAFLAPPIAIVPWIGRPPSIE